MNAIDAFLDRVATGPCALEIDGPAGIGKSTLWERATDAAADRGWRVLACRAAEGEAHFAYAGVAELLQSVFEEVWSQLIEPHRRAMEAALLGTADDDSVPQHAVAAGVLGALTIMSRTGPALLAIDDAPWLDPPSARVLGYVCRRLRALQVGIVASARTPLSGLAPLGLDRAFADDRRTRLALQPLSMAAVHHIIAPSIDADLSRQVLVRVYEASGGNPLLALELARAIRDLGRPLAADDPLPVSGELSDVIATRVNALPTDTKQLLLVVAAATVPTIPTLLGVTGTSAWETSGGPAAETAGVIELRDGIARFTHPLLASAAYGGASPVARRDVHRRLADFATSPEVRAHHLSRTVTGPDAEIAAALDAGARSAWARGAPAVAADMSRRALDATPPAAAGDRQRRTIDAATYLIETREPDLATQLLDELVGSPTDRERLTRARLLLARVHQERGDLDAAFRVLKAAVADAPPAGPERRRLDLDIAWTALFLGNVELGDAYGGAVLEEARREDDGFMVASASAMLLFNEFMAGRGLRGDLLETAMSRQEDHTSGPLEPASALAVATALSLADQLDAARAIFVKEGHAAEGRGSEWDLAFLLSNRADLEWRDGHFDAAIEYADRAIELADLGENRLMRGLGLFPRARALACLGRVDEARGAGEEGLEIGFEAGHAVCISANTTVLGFLEWSIGDATATHARLGPLGQIHRGTGFREPGFMLWVSDEVEALVALGALDDAAELVGWFDGVALESQRPSALGRAARCCAVLALAQGDAAAAVAHAERAVEVHQTTPLPIDHGRSLLVRGQALRRAKQKLAARDSLQASVDLFERLQMPLWAARGASELARVGLRSRDHDGTGLTETERQVAELAAKGLHNREIAAELFVSERTVATHLSRAYAKLGVTSRAGLGIALAAERH